jgi:hypothetical protein
MRMSDFPQISKIDAAIEKAREEVAANATSKDAKENLAELLKIRAAFIHEIERNLPGVVEVVEEKCGS